MNVSIRNLPESLSFPVEVAENIRRAAEMVGKLYGVENGEVSVTLTDDEHIHEMNRQYRGIDRPTDVLSFALHESDEPPVEGGPAVDELGDIILSVERAQAQAAEYGHSVRREITFLTVHGMLHLLGYDHIEEQDRVEMEEEQRYVMEKLGISRDDKDDMKLTDHAGEIPVPAAEQGGKHMDFHGHKSGFVAVIGRPNVGKSTLINTLIGQKIAIMSDKPQTTRNRILCILTKPDMQVVFLDTPGIHKPRHKLGEYMVKAAEGTLKEVDVILFVVDATEKMGPGEYYILERLQATNKPVLLIVNKLDLIEKERALPIISHYTEKYPFAGVVPISAKENENLDALLEEVGKYLPEGPQYYPDDMVTDQPERLIVAELIREKILELTRDEVPHSVAVETEEMKTRENGDAYVRATIYVERESQKGIIIGAKGSMLKDIGALARKDIETLLGCRVYLELWVKVKKDWRDRDGVLRNFGFGQEK